MPAFKKKNRKGENKGDHSCQHPLWSSKEPEGQMEFPKGNMGAEKESKVSSVALNS